jgi:hypothetical protein
MALTWGEYWLLDTAVRAWIPLRFLVHPRITDQFNGPGHHLDERELVDALERLLDGGDILIRGQRRPSRAELSAALVYVRGAPPRDPLCYGLTAQGGARWEAIARADWSAFVEDVHYRHDDGTYVRELTGVDRERVARQIPPGVDARWARVEPWAVTPWKTLPLAHRAVLPWVEGRPLAARDPWTIEPDGPRGALYSTALDDGRRGLVRVIETLDGHRFAILCDWVGHRHELPSNLSRLARRFMPLGFGRWNNRLFGRWVEGPPPDGFVFQGVVEVTPAELDMALGTGTTGSWVDLPAMALREWRWREEGLDARVHLASGPPRSTELRARATALHERLRALQAAEPAEPRAQWARRDMERWRARLEEAFRRLLSTNRGPAIDVRVDGLSSDGLELDLTLGFREGAAYCCDEADCHHGLHDRCRWDRLRDHLKAIAPNLDPPLLTVRRVIVEVAPGARFERRFSESQRFDDQGWREADTLRSSPRWPDGTSRDTLGA